MEAPMHNLNALFAQLGLDNSDEAIDAFISEHAPFEEACRLYQADFWNHYQADFLKDALEDEADWADAIHQLDALLRR